MEISTIISAIYIVLGFLCATYWFKKNYEKEYNKALEEGNKDAKSMGVLIILIMAVTWPIIFVWKFIKAL